MVRSDFSQLQSIKWDAARLKSSGQVRSSSRDFGNLVNTRKTSKNTANLSFSPLSPARAEL
jgi:hypothetical protein